MGKIINGMTISLDGFVGDSQGGVERLYADLQALQDTEMLQQAMEQTGAVVMGRHSYDMGNGDFTGYEFQVPLFVVTHHPPAQAAKGENDKLKFHYVSDGVKSALEQAKTAAGNKDVMIVGGASTFRQALATGLVDELHITIVPVLLGDGLPLFSPAEKTLVELETVRVVPSLSGRTDMIFRVVK